MSDAVTDYRYDATRKNNPPAGLAPQARIRETPKVRYAYDPHLPPELRFDPTGESDRLPELLEESTRRALTVEEARRLADALRKQQPWLEWAGKRERDGFVVDPVALHIHERVSAQAVIKMAQREDLQRELFADPRQPYREAIQFYQHDVDWSNRLILGDSLQVMVSLANREDLCGKVQMIYVDPPYGIRFASNFQNEVGQRVVKDTDADLTREPEVVRAYRDTWTLGVHSYLGYLRDRLLVCRDLLTDSGSIFVQISDENLHRVRTLLDEVFGAGNAMGLIFFSKTSSSSTDRLSSVGDYLIWYARDKTKVKHRRLYRDKAIGGDGADQYTWIDRRDGRRWSIGRPVTNADLIDGDRVLRADNLTSQRPAGDGDVKAFSFNGETFTPGKGTFKTDLQGLTRLAASNRLIAVGNTLSYARFIDDFPVIAISNLWDDTVVSGFSDKKRYVVQTSTRVVERCLLMTTDPGDLVLDPTCGSGTTAFVCEQWGRRWITVDSSRVALAIARQRLLTSRFDQFATRASTSGVAQSHSNPADGFVYKTVPHITLGSIAKNRAIDAIAARYAPMLELKLEELNRELKRTTADVRRKLRAKLEDKERHEGSRAITEADRRRCALPTTGWKEWEVPFDSDDDWPTPLREALADYRTIWREKMDEVDAAIAANAESVELVDRPETVPAVVRVAGPFTVEAVMPAESSLVDSADVAPEEDLDTFGYDPGDIANEEAYLDRMRRLLLADGVRFPNNKIAAISRLDALDDPYLHAEGEWNADNGHTRRVAVSFGPQHGPVTAVQVESALHSASRRGFEDVIFAGFSFDGAAQAVIQDDPNPRVRSHLAHIRPDVQMTGLLKETPNSQLFTVFGTPRTSLRQLADGRFTVTMEGVDVYNPVENTIVPTRADKVAAWFLDADYDGRTFCITHAFFPDKSAWQKLARALKGQIDEDFFASLSGTTSPPFEAGQHRRCAVKVIDPRGNEVMRVHRIDAPARTAQPSR